VSDRVAVMYLGKIVESAAAADLYKAPAHPYTEALMAAVPDVEKGLESRRGGGRAAAVLTGDIPSASKIIPGCPFHPRCPRAKDRCRREVPVLREVGEGHKSACHFAEEVLSSG